jgi:hypothetical protein
MAVERRINYLRRTAQPVLGPKGVFRSLLGPLLSLGPCSTLNLTVMAAAAPVAGRPCRPLLAPSRGRVLHATIIFTPLNQWRCRANYISIVVWTMQRIARSGTLRVAGDNKLGLYRQCGGAKRVRGTRQNTGAGALPIQPVVLSRGTGDVSYGD